MPEEHLYEVDWNDNVLGIIPKSEMRQRNAIHRVALIIPRVVEGKFLLARRAKEKHPFPDVWVCAVGGKVRAGESYEQAALREMQEEVGMQTALEFVATSKMDSDRERAIYHVFTTKEVIDINKVQPEPSETQYVKAFSLKEIQEMIVQKADQFAPSFRFAVTVFQKELERNWKA